MPFGVWCRCCVGDTARLPNWIVILGVCGTFYPEKKTIYHIIVNCSTSRMYRLNEAMESIADKIDSSRHDCLLIVTIFIDRKECEKQKQRAKRQCEIILCGRIVCHDMKLVVITCTLVRPIPITHFSKSLRQ